MTLEGHWKGSPFDDPDTLVITQDDARQKSGEEKSFGTYLIRDRNKRYFSMTLSRGDFETLREFIVSSANKGVALELEFLAEFAGDKREEIFARFKDWRCYEVETKSGWSG